MDKSLLARLAGRHEFYLGLLVLLLAIGLSAGTDEFLTLGNLTDVATSYAILGILACGLFVVLIAGGIDISFPAVTAIAQYVMASWVIQHGGSFPLAFALAIGVGLLLGLVNGFLVYWLKVPAIIITIATLNLFYGLLVYATNGTWLYGFPDWFMNGINWFSFQGADGYDYGLTLPLLPVGDHRRHRRADEPHPAGAPDLRHGRQPRRGVAPGVEPAAAAFLRLRLHGAFWPASRRWCRRRSPSRWPQLAARLRADGIGGGGVGRHQHERRPRLVDRYPARRGAAGLPAKRADAAQRLRPIGTRYSAARSF